MHLSALSVTTRSKDGLQQHAIEDVDSLNALCGRLSDVQESQNFLIFEPSDAECERFPTEGFTVEDSAAVGIFPLVVNSELAEDLSELPATVAVRVNPPESVAVLSLPVHALATGDSTGPPFREVSCPIWDWMIRYVDRGGDVQVWVSTSGPTLSCSPLAHPRLVPPPVDACREWIRPHLLSGSPLGQSHSSADAVALRAGLLQMQDFLEASHQLSQSVEGEGRHASADYWHGIMHRREPDYGNSKYWFRRVGRHPIFSSLADRAQNILQNCLSPEAPNWPTKLVTSSGWDPFAFVDLCEACEADEDTPLSIAVREIQWQEMRLLLLQTYRDAINR